jgi:hypothetical protein
MTSPIAGTAEQPVSDTDYIQLDRLVIEAVWRIDLGRADTYHELFVEDGELILPPTTDRGRVVVPETTLRAKPYTNGGGDSSKRSRSEPFDTCAETCASWPTAPTRR